MRVTIRNFDPVTDTTKCLELGREMHMESSMRDISFSEKKVLDLFRKAVDYPEDTFYRVFENEDGDLIGFFYGVITEYYFSEETWALDKFLYVLPMYRGSHAASKVVKDFKKWSIDREVREVAIMPSTGIQTDRTVAFLGKIGFEKRGVITKHTVEG